MKRALTAMCLLIAASVFAAGPDVVVRSAPAIRGGSGSWDYTSAVDATGAAYPWIDATTGTNLGSGDDSLLSFNFPFAFEVYDDAYTTSDVIEVNTNGSVHFDQGGPRSLWVNCGDIPSTGDGQWVAPLGDDLIANDVWYLVSGTAPNRVLTIQWAVTEYSSTGVAELQVNLFEGTNIIVTQTRITTPFTFTGDGVVGINAGDGVWGEEVACGADTGLPSSEFDVEFIPQGLQPTPTPQPPTPTPAGATPVPTMTGWGLAVLLVTMAGAAVLLLRRRS